MINQNRVRRMTRMAAYEDREGRRDARITGYFRTDYLTRQALITFVCGTVAFLILFAAYALYHFEDMIEKIYSLDLEEFVLLVLLQYALFVGILLAVTIAVYSLRYSKARARQRGYRKDLLQLAARYRRR